MTAPYSQLSESEDGSFSCPRLSHGPRATTATCSEMAAHKYMEAGYHERYSEDEIEDNPPAVSLDGEAARNPKSYPRRDAEGQISLSLDEPSGSSDSLRTDSQANTRIQAQTEVSYRSTNLTKRALEPSWINAEPFDEFIREISDFIIGATRGRMNVEVSPQSVPSPLINTCAQVEAKIGVLIDVRANHRLNLPVKSEIS
jgi:hypothetical protein